MTHNEFNLEQAKAGEPVMYRYGAPVKFIGLSSTGFIVVEDSDGYFVACDGNELRMAPKKVKIRYRNYMLSDSVHSSVSVLIDSRSLESPQEIEKKSWFRGWIHTDWQETEITE